LTQSIRRIVTSRDRFRAGTWYLAALLAGSCSSTATVERRDGPPTEGRIERSDEDGLYLSDDQGRILRLDRRQVADIDHPGNVCMTVGAVITTLFVSALASKEASGGEFVSPGRTYAIGGVGVAMSLWGGYWYYRSVSAASAYDNAPKIIRIGPKAAPLPSFAPLFADAGASPSPDAGVH
jgi:hypothetical protein